MKGSVFMKYTAEFDSINTAEIAAAALKKYISSFSEINVYDKLHQHTGDDHSGFVLFSGFNPTVTSPLYNGTVSAVEIPDDDPTPEVSMRTCPTLEVVCRSEDAKNVSRIIIGYGGRNIRTKK